MSARALLAAALACGLLACRPGNAGPVQQEVDVLVPGPVDGGADGPASADAEAGEAGPGAQVDRAGHPLTTVLLVPGTLQDGFNAQPTFEANVPRIVQDALEARLEALDTLVLGDGGPDPVDYPVPEGGTHPLLPAFVTDVLLVDTALGCTADGGFAASYFEIEREIYLGGPVHTTCGGRTPDEDVVDETLTLLVTDGGRPVSQGVAGPTRAASTTFPYLAPPN